MKPLHWDAINPYTGTPFTFDDPNLFWGDPSYYLEVGDPGFVPYPGMSRPPPKPKKPFRRQAKLPALAQPYTPHPTTMPTFKYNVAPKSTGGFTTRAVRTRPIADSALLDSIATAATVTPAQAEAVLRAFARALQDCASDTCWSPGFLGLYTFRPTSGGSSPLPDGFHNAADINADISLSLLPDIIATWQSQLTLESQGEVGKLTPAIETIIRQSDGAQDRYTPGGLIQVRGDHLNFQPTDPAQGIFLTPASGAEVRVTDYAVIKPQSVVILVPAALSGPLSVRVATFINGSVRSDTYTTPVTTGP